MDPSIKRYTKQYPIGPARDIQVNMQDGHPMFKWIDPEDPIMDKVYFSKWEFTRILRKKDEPPKDTWDGEILAEIKERNTYKDEYFIDTTAELGETYYYAIIPCSDLGIHYWNKLDIIKIIPTEYDPVFENNTWETIITMVHNRCADKIWNPGDSKEMDLGLGLGTHRMYLSCFVNEPQDKYNTDKDYKYNMYLDSMVGVDISKASITQESWESDNGILTRFMNDYNKDIFNTPLYTDNSSRIKKLDGVAIKYNVGDTVIDETGKVHEGMGEITNIRIPKSEI